MDNSYPDITFSIFTLLDLVRLWLIYFCRGLTVKNPVKGIFGNLREFLYKRTKVRLVETHFYF